MLYYTICCSAIDCMGLSYARWLWHTLYGFGMNSMMKRSDGLHGLLRARWQRVLPASVRDRSQ